VLAPVPVALASLARRHEALARVPRRLEIPAAGDPVTFTDDVIVCRGDEGVRVFSARCPHLGCRIGRVEGETLVCPCHGSRFHLDGRVAAGPAARPLQPLPFTRDPRTGSLIVHVS
jgi:Rieske Fe-S protein